MDLERNAVETGDFVSGSPGWRVSMYYWLVRVHALKAVRDLRDPVESRTFIFPGAWDRDFSVVPQC